MAIGLSYSLQGELYWRCGTETAFYLIRALCKSWNNSFGVTASVPGFLPIPPAFRLPPYPYFSKCSCFAKDSSVRFSGKSDPERRDIFHTCVSASSQDVRRMLTGSWSLFAIGRIRIVFMLLSFGSNERFLL